MNNLSQKQINRVGKNDDELFKPIILDSTEYELCSAYEKSKSINPFTVWGLYKELNIDDEQNTMINNILDKRLSKNETSADNDKYCSCINVWKKLKQVLELTDEELKMACQTESLFHEDVFRDLVIDLNDDDYGENLEDFKLDGEYLYEIPLSDLNSIEQYKKEEKSVPEIKEEKKVKKNTAVRVKDQDKEFKIDASKSNDTINGKKTKVIDGINQNSSQHSRLSQKITKVTNRNQDVKNKTKTYDKLSKRGTKIEMNEFIDNETKKIPKEIEYVYTYGEKYIGGIIIGHKNCIDSWKPLPNDKSWVTDDFLAKVSGSIRNLLIENLNSQKSDTVSDMLIQYGSEGSS